MSSLSMCVCVRVCVFVSKYGITLSCAFVVEHYIMLIFLVNTPKVNGIIFHHMEKPSTLKPSVC